MNRVGLKKIFVVFIVIGSFFIIPLHTSAPAQVITDNTEKIPVKIYNLYDQTKRTQTIELRELFSFFEPIHQQKESIEYNDLQTKLDQFHHSTLFNEREKSLIHQDIQITSIKSPNFYCYPQGLFFDLFNVFNGFGFAMKGQKTRSFLDLPVARFPFLDSNFTALFSGFNAFEGNGFIFTLGTNGFRYIYDYDKNTYDFPYFSSINGWFIGYTGIILEAVVPDVFGETYEGIYIIGVGMNVVTLWNT